MERCGGVCKAGIGKKLVASDAANVVHAGVHELVETTLLARRRCGLLVKIIAKWASVEQWHGNGTLGILDDDLFRDLRSTRPGSNLAGKSCIRFSAAAAMPKSYIESSGVAPVRKVPHG